MSVSPGYARNSLTCVHIRRERARIGQCRAGNQHQHGEPEQHVCTTDEVFCISSIGD